PRFPRDCPMHHVPRTEAAAEARRCGLFSRRQGQPAMHRGVYASQPVLVIVGSTMSAAPVPEAIGVSKNVSRNLMGPLPESASQLPGAGCLPAEMRLAFSVKRMNWYEWIAPR